MCPKACLQKWCLCDRLGVEIDRRRNDLYMIYLDGRGRGGRHRARAVAFVRARRAEMVVVENVAESDGVSAITTTLTGISGYTWMKQTLSAREHAGAPVTREREFWVGLRGAVVLVAVAV